MGVLNKRRQPIIPTPWHWLYMKRNDVANPDITRKALGLLDRGYGKLTSFECQQTRL